MGFEYTTLVVFGWHTSDIAPHLPIDPTEHIDIEIIEELSKHDGWSRDDWGDLGRWDSGNDGDIDLIGWHIASFGRDEVNSPVILNEVREQYEHRFDQFYEKFGHMPLLWVFMSVM